MAVFGGLQSASCSFLFFLFFGDESVVGRREKEGKRKGPIIPSDFMGREMMPRKDGGERFGKVWEEEGGKEGTPFPAALQ